MALTDLNVALRLSTREFNRELNKVEKSLQAASDRLAGIGDRLSLAISAPILAMGGAAIVAAGEFEKLRLGLEATMTDAGYSIQQAREELELLREVAKAPGIDFKQAVQGSLRLQSVGLSADQARETIAQFANGVAAAGGTAENLEGVTRQISQIISKGKVLNEDLVILKENMPSVSKALVNAFGTADAEGLRKLNISADELVVRLTQELAKAPRVAGGIANSIQNVQVAVTEAAAKIGDSLNAAFDIKGALDRFAAFVTRIADAFAELSPETQRAVFALTAFAVALGPAIRLGGLLTTGFIQTQLEMAKFVRFLNAQLAQSLAGGATGIRGLIAAFKALDLATKTTVIGIAIGVVVALGAALVTYRSVATDAAQAQITLNKTLQEAKGTVQTQVEELNQLVRAYGKEGATLQEKEAILKRLAIIDEKRFGNLKAETTAQNDLLKPLKAVTDELIRQAQVKLAVDQIAKLKNELIDVRDESKLTFGQTSAITIKALGKTILEPIKAAENFKGAIRDAQGQIVDNESKVRASLERQISTLQKFIDENATAADLGVKTASAAPTAPTGPPTNQPDDLAGLVDQLLAQNENEEKFLKSYFENVVKDKFGPLQTLDSNLKIGFDNAKVGLADFAARAAEATNTVSQGFVLQQQAAAAYKAQLDSLASATGILITLTDEGFKGIINTADLLTQTVTSISGALAGALESGANSFEQFGRAVLAAVGDIIGALVKQFVATQIANAAKNPAIAALGPAGIPIAAAAGTLAAAAFKRVVGAAKFAKGGIVYGPTLGLVGEYPGASNNPEVIAPLNKLRSLINPTGDMRLETRISGNDLVVLVERTQKQLGRTR